MVSDPGVIYGHIFLVVFFTQTQLYKFFLLSCIHYYLYECNNKIYLLLICLCSWYLITIFTFAPKNLLFWVFKFEVSLFCRPKLIWLEFSSKLQLPKMPGKFQHDQFWVGKFDNFMLTNIIILVFIFIIIRFSLIYLPSFPDCMIG